MDQFVYANLILIPIFFAIPALVLYFIVKIAVKNAIKEAKRVHII